MIRKLILQKWEISHILERRKDMPTICSFLGIIITMYFKQSEHNPPHVHVKCGNKIATIDIETLDYKCDNKFPKKKLNLAIEFVRNYKDDLLNMWNTETISRIEE